MEPAIANLNRLAELYPRYTTLTDDRWMAMRATLIDGFTIGQLEEYIKRTELDSNSSSITSATTADDKTEWKAALTSVLDKRGNRRSKFSSSSAAAVKAEYTNLRRYLQGKSGLAERILRVVWGLERPGDLGRLEFRLDDLKMYVLLNHQHQHHQHRGSTFGTEGGIATTSSFAGILKRIADLYDAKIDIQGNKNLIKITGTKMACNSCHDAIHECIERIRQYDFSPRGDLRLSKYIDAKSAGTVEKVEDEFLDMLESEYHVIVDSKGRGSRTVCSIISPDINTFNDASRTVELAMHLQSKPTLASTASFNTFVENGNRIPLSRLDDLSILNWLERHAAGNYLRWVSPIAQEAIPGGRSARRPPMNAIGHDNDGPMVNVRNEIFKTVKGKPTKKILTSPHVREVVDARVGNVLFFKMDQVQQTKTGNQVEDGLAGEKAQEDVIEVKEETSPEILTFDQLMEQHKQSASFHPNAIPVVDDILRASQPLASDYNCQLYRVQLHPSSKNPQAPVIEVEISCPSQHGVSSSKHVIIHRAVAILHPQTQHMLLPWTYTDLQFTRSWHYDMFEGKVSNEEAEEGNPISSIRDVFSNIRFNHRSSPESLSLPATAKLLLPSGLTPPSSTSALEYEYILPYTNHLVSSQLHRFKYRDHELDYQTISGGGVLPIVNRSVMLTMNRYDDSPVPPILRDGETTDEQKMNHQSPTKDFRQFYAAATRLAFEIGAIAMEQGKGNNPEQVQEVKNDGDEYGDADDLDEYIAKNIGI
ncbi:hypothetical protein KEM54_006272 [Ascosphaera aggregata]|nr:hypothetical protein KEM54_006272 [Ascosphaera aggregata]